MRLQIEAETYGVEFNDHYLRRNADGTVTATVFGYKGELNRLADAGYDLGATLDLRDDAEFRDLVTDRVGRPLAGVR